MKKPSYKRLYRKHLKRQYKHTQRVSDLRDNTPRRMVMYLLDSTMKNRNKFSVHTETRKHWYRDQLRLLKRYRIGIWP